MGKCSGAKVKEALCSSALKEETCNSGGAVQVLDQANHTEPKVHHQLEDDDRLIM